MLEGQTKSHAVVGRIIRRLGSYGGFDNWWDTLGPDAQASVIKELVHHPAAAIDDHEKGKCGFCGTLDHFDDCPIVRALENA